MIDRSIKAGKPPEHRAAWEAELATSGLPAALADIWATYHRLRRRAGGTGFGPSPISWSAIEAFQRVSFCRLSPWEIEVIEMIDDLFLAEAARSNKSAPDKDE